MRRPSLLLLSLLLAPAMPGCEEESVLLGADLCPPTDCGSELAVPSRSCVDGTTGGYTGRCMRDEALTACHWEIVDCPPLPECQPSDCGTFPTAYTASADEAVACRREADGQCHWTVMDLPGCEPADCGPAPEAAAAMICPGGELGGFTGQCIIGAAGECVWEVAECPAPLVGVTDADCSLAECGQQPPDARLACADGTAAGNTGRCLRDGATGTCAWEVLDCATPVECASNDECAPTEFCDRSAVACNMGIRGMCSLRPTECPTYVDGADRRVCACDGLTYDSACAAQLLGVSIASDGPCT